MQTHAVILIGGKQYLVKEGDTITVDSLDKSPKDSIDLPVLMKFSSEEDVSYGTPHLDVVAKAEVVENVKGEKIRVAKFKSKVRYRKVRGFRPQLTTIKILSI
jgi:large subunit ribosomal protein L21